MEQNNLNEEQANMVSLNRPNEPQQYNQQTQEEEKGITLSQIWHMIIKHWVALVILILVGFAGGFGYSKFIKTPKYQSSIQLMIITPQSESTSTSSNISLSLQKTNIAYNYIKYDEVATSVAKKMAAKNYDVNKKDTSGNKIENEYDLTTVKSYYSVSIPTVVSNTTSIFLTVTSTCKTEAMAIDVVNFVAESAIELTNTPGTNGYAYLNNSLNTMGSATQAKDTSTSTLVISAIGALIGLVVGAAYGIIRELTNTHVSSKQELETLSGYKVIGMIPKQEVKEDEEEEKGENENA